MISIKIKPLDYSKSFNQLTEKEKLYCYYLNKACWAGIPISSFQISYESPALFIIFQSFFSSFESLENLEEIVLKNKMVTKFEFDSFILYTVHFYSCYGNYFSFGHLKRFPQLSCDKFEEILKVSSKYDSFCEIWNRIKSLLYKDISSLPKISSKYSDPYIVGTYYLNGITFDEIKKIDELLTKKKISLVNTRLQKVNDNIYEVLIASIEEKEEKLEFPNENITLILKYGDFKDYLILINSYLEKAKLYASNDMEKKIIDLYMDTFRTGDIEIHKESQRVWIKNISPVVEYNLGWVETYIDPRGVRAYYEGITALKDKNASTKYQVLVDNSQYFIDQLPWDKNFEKENFMSPDFTALDIVGFPTTSIFIGINLPNYLDIHDKDGFKNLTLLNAYDNYDNQLLQNIIFPQDIELIQKIGLNVSMFKTALHELLGHGSGKLFTVDENGKYNFDKENIINPLTKEKVNSFYLPGETYESKFSVFCRALEEGRADYIALYLVFDKKAQKIFGFKDEEYEDVIYIMWLEMFIAGIFGVGFYKNGRWDSPYSQERFMFLNYIFQNQEQDKKIISFDIDELNRRFKIVVNKDNLIKYGRSILSNMLITIHVSKCIADVKSAENLVNKYGVVDEYMNNIYFMAPYLKTIQKEMNIDLKMDEKDGKKIVQINEYPSTPIGFIKSVVDRFKYDYNEITFRQWTKYFNPIDKK